MTTSTINPLDEIRTLAQDLPLYALVDGCLLQDAPRGIRLQFPLHQAHSLFKDITDPEIIAAGPLLFEITLPHQIENLEKLLIDPRRGLPLVSLIVSQHDAATLSTVLADFIDVRLDDGSEMVMRFYDPRILPFWWQQMASAYRQRLSNNVTAWVMPDQHLYPQALPLEKTEQNASSTPLKFPMQLSQEQEFALMDASAPYTSVERFRNRYPEALALLSPEKRYDFFVTQTQRAADHGIPEGYAQDGFCKLALELGEEFDTHPHMQAALEAVKAGTSFEQAIQQITPLQWLDIQTYARASTSV